MATKSKYFTLHDLAKAKDPDGQIAQVVELLAQQNPIIEMLPFIEGNLTTGHKTTLRSQLPTPVWRRLYEGVPVSKSARAQIEETAGEMSSRNEVDTTLLKLTEHPEEVMMDEAESHFAAMNIKAATSVFYGSVSSGDPFNGLATRYNALGAQTISAGGSANTNTSIYVCVLSKATVHGIFPKGTTAGIQREDLGVIDAFDGNNNRYRARADLWTWNMGLVVRDYRAIVRIANIDAADLLTAGTASGTQAAAAATNILRKIVEAKNRIPPMVRAQGPVVAFLNSRSNSAIELLGMEKSANAVKLEEGLAQGRKSFNGVTFVECDGLLNTEANVS